jgi:hypothetical protein
MLEEVRDLCEPCADTTIVYTIQGHTGSCADLANAERLQSIAGATGTSADEDSARDGHAIIGTVLALLALALALAVFVYKARNEEDKLEYCMKECGFKEAKTDPPAPPAPTTIINNNYNQPHRQITHRASQLNPVSQTSSTTSAPLRRTSTTSVSSMTSSTTSAPLRRTSVTSV